MLSFRIALVATLLAAPVWAAPWGPGRHAGSGPGFGHRPGGDDRLAELAEILELDETQRAAFDQMRAEHRAVAVAKMAEMRALHAELDALLDAGSNDAAAVGAKMLEIRRLRDELRAQREAGQAEFVKLLDAEQRIAFEALERAREARREERREMRPGFGPRRGGPGLDRR
jgi:Spy/CpxP family protein refolding chaperone